MSKYVNVNNINDILSKSKRDTFHKRDLHVLLNNHKDFLIVDDLGNVTHRGEETRVVNGKHGMRTEVNVEKLINTFRNMANRGTLLARGDVSQEDLLIQIMGAIVKVATDSDN